MTAALSTAITRIPAELRAIPHWVSHLDKVPKNPRTGANASPTDSATWGTCADAVMACSKRGHSGVGFVFSDADPFSVLDLDKCFDGDELQAWARSIVERTRGAVYWERSPSGQGLRGIGRGVPPQWRKKKGQLEIYFAERFATITGDVFEECSRIGDDSTDLITAIHREYFGDPPQERKTTPPAGAMPADDIEIVERCQRFRNGGKFADLMAGSTAHHGGDKSAADAALLESILWANGGDIDQAVRIACTSMLWREKWESKRGDTDYIHYTAERILAKMTNFYDPQRNQPVMPIVKNLTVEPAPVSGGSAAIEAPPVDSTVATSTVGNDQTVCIPVDQWQALQAENERLRTENTLFRDRLHHLEGIRKNRGLGSCKDTAAALVGELTLADRNDQARSDGFLPIRMKKLAEAAGRSEDTVRRDIKHLVKAGIARTKIETRHEEWKDADGKVTYAGPVSTVYFKPFADIDDFGNVLRTVDLSPIGRKTKEQKPCPKCGIDAGVTIRTFEVCNGCGHQTEMPDKERPPVAETQEGADETARETRGMQLATPPLQADEPAADRGSQLAGLSVVNHEGSVPRKGSQLATPSDLPPPERTLAAIVQEKTTLSEYQETSEALRQSHLTNGKTYRLEVSA